MKHYKFKKSFRFEGKRYYAYGKTEAEAIRNMARKRLELEQGLVTYDSHMLVKDWAKEALQTYKADLSGRAYYDTVKRIEKHILPELGDLQIGKVKPIHCQRLINSKTGYSKEYIEKISQNLKFIFTKAKENGMIRENPAEYIVKPKGHKTPRRSITDHERKHLLKVCENDRFLPFLFMLYCGCRPAEALGIEYRDITKKNKIPFLHIRGTKTDNSDRTVPIPADLARRIPKGKDPFAPLFVNAHGNRYTQSSYRALTKALYRELNISMGCRIYRNQLVAPYPLADDFVPYDLRHTFCTDLQKMGIDVRTAQALMGHADISTTANIYTHQDDETLLVAAEKMGYETGGTPGRTPKECIK